MRKEERNEDRDPRYAQADREALLALGAYAAYFGWWYVCAYGLGDGDPAAYSYVLGLPAWFFYSCVVGYGLIVLLLWGMVRFLYKDMPLDAELPEESSDGTSPIPPTSPTPRAGGEASGRAGEGERP